MADAKRDQNYVTTLLGVSSVDGVTPIPIRVDPVTGRVLVQSPGGGSGTVTSVSIVSANGISGSVATATTTPAITLTLGAITPTSVNGLTITTTTGTLTVASGKTLTISNTLTLTGTDGSSVNFGTGGTVLYSGGALGTPSSATLTNATGLPVATGISGLGTGVATALAVNIGTAGAFVVNGGALGTPSSGNLANCTFPTLNQNTTGTASNVTGVVALANGGTGQNSLITAPTASTIVGQDANKNYSANNVIEGFTTTATAAGTTTMVVGDTYQQYWTGTTTQTVKLPTTGIAAGQQYQIVNNSTGNVTVQSSGANTIQILGAGMSATFTALVATPTTAANWACVLISGRDTENAITASSNAATIDLAYITNKVTNNSAATLTITLPTAGAIDGERRIVKVVDFSAVAQTIAWTNTENSTVTAPTTSNGSTTLPLTVGFQYNGLTSKWRCVAVA